MSARPLHLRSLRAFLAFFAALALAAAACAQTGAISGRVTDASTGLALGGARVAISGTNLVTFAGPSGDYTLANVPAGTRSVEISYVGYPERTEPITVADGRTAHLNVLFGEDVVTVDTLVIQGAAVGSARAINQQRASDTLTNIVAADAIGRFPDQNAAEAMQRIPGVSLYRDQGEGRYIVLRGLNYSFTSVKVNGGSFAGADLGERATALDVIPADALAAIKVTKVPTPDMDGEGLGGQVDIKTKSPFDADGFAASLSAQGQYASLTDEYSSKFNGYVSQRFGDNNQYGFLIAPTWQERKFGSYNYETGGAWFEPAGSSSDPNLAPGAGGAASPFYTAESLEFRDYVINRERYGLTTAFEARPDSSLSMYVNAGYNRFTDTESRHLTLFDFTEASNLSAASASSATYTGLRRYARRLRIREKDQEVFTVVAGAEKRLGAWTLDARAGYTKGEEKRPDELTVRFRRNTRDTTLRYDTDGAYGLTVSQLAGASFYDPASYNFQRIDLANESGSETGTDLGFNARYDLATVNPAYLKFGALFRTKEKDAEGEAYELDGAPTSFTFASLAEPAGDYPYLRVPRISTDAVKRAFYSNRSAFTGDRVFEDSEYEDFSLTEDVLAAYVMSGITFDQLNVIAGLRMERTEFETTGKELDLVNETATARTASNSYTHWLPGLYFRYDATDRLVLRASWSHSLARPSFGDTAFRSLVNSDDEELTIGNPQLEALEATNWDASVEYYLPSLGLLSASVFHKEIENFSYEYSIDNGATVNGDPYDLTTYANGSDGAITGLELAYEHQLRFLPKPFDGLGVMANITFLDSEATYPTRPGEEVPFIGQSDYTGNLGLTYEKAGFFLRLAMNFRSERLREDEPLGGAAYQDLYVDDFEQLDLTVRYKLNARWELFAEALNLTNEPFRVFLKSPNGQGDRLGQFEEYDWSANFGIRVKL